MDSCPQYEAELIAMDTVELKAELNNLRDIVQALSSQVYALNSRLEEVAHLSSRKVGESSDTRERFLGEYAFGEKVSPGNGAQSRTSVIFEEGSELLLRFTPKLGYHPATKEYVDGLYNNLSQQMLKSK